ncbi:MAG: hypothetical protein ABJA78_18505 [Ferruginibacter sp.]
MKNAFFLFSLITISIVAKSQISKGNWLVGGSGSLYSYNEDYQTTPPVNSVQYKYLNVDISASIGYFLLDKIVLGLRPAFSWFKGKGVSFTGNASGGSTDNKRYQIGPFGRYYFLKKDKEFNIVGDISYQYGVVDLNDPSNGHLNTFTISAGPVLYFNSSVGLEILLGYSSRNEFYGDNKDYRKGFLTSIGLQIDLEKK